VWLVVTREEGFWVLGGFMCAKKVGETPSVYRTDSYLNFGVKSRYPRNPEP
jgi:hypothetical protein